jgi:hypothetical protein
VDGLSRQDPQKRLSEFQRIGVIPYAPKEGERGNVLASLTAYLRKSEVRRLANIVVGILGLATEYSR